MSVDVPKLKVPFSVSGGRVEVLEQDTLDQIAQCVYVLLSTELGSRIELPDYGISQQAFKKGGVDVVELQDSVSTWEKRVEGIDVETEWDGLLQRVRVLISG